MEYDYELYHEVGDIEYYCCSELMHEGDYSFTKGFEMPDEYTIIRDPSIRILDLFDQEDQRINPTSLTKEQYLDIVNTMTQIYWDNFLEDVT